MEKYTKALELLFVGMTTVVTILLLVVLSASLLIKLMNRFGPAPPLPKKKSTKIEPKKLAVLAAVVEHITKGKGVITDIKKAN